MLYFLQKTGKIPAASSLASGGWKLRLGPQTPELLPPSPVTFSKAFVVLTSLLSRMIKKNLEIA